MNKIAKFEESDDNKTGNECHSSANYCCYLHSYVERYIGKGDIFPMCDKEKGHETKWWKKVQ